MYKIQYSGFFSLWKIWKFSMNWQVSGKFLNFFSNWARASKIGMNYIYMTQYACEEKYMMNSKIGVPLWGSPIFNINNWDRSRKFGMNDTWYVPQTIGWEKNCNLRGDGGGGLPRPQILTSLIIRIEVWNSIWMKPVCTSDHRLRNKYCGRDGARNPRGPAIFNLFNNNWDRCLNLDLKDICMHLIDTIQ